MSVLGRPTENPVLSPSASGVKVTGPTVESHPTPTLPPPPPPAPDPGWRTEQNLSGPYAAWKANPGPQTGGALLAALDPAIRAGVRTYAADSGPTGYGRAKAIVMSALPRYDPTKAGLKTFVSQHLQGLQRYRAGQVNAIKVPDRLLLARNALKRAESELTDSLGRPPSAAELADHTGLPKSTIAAARSVAVAAPESRFAGGYDSDSTYGGDPAVRRTGDDSGWVRLVYHSVDDRDRVVLEHTLGLFGASVLSTGELARKLGVSPAAVSQRKAKLQAVLDKRDDLKLI